MRTRKIIFIIAFSIFNLTVTNTKAQDEVDNSPFSFGADFVNRYIFRGPDFGNSPAIQPSFDFSKGGFSIGAWGSYAFVSTSTGIEADLYTSYSFNFGLTIGVTNYYFPGEQLRLGSDSIIAPERTGGYFNGDKHFSEINVTQNISNFYLSANYDAFNLDNVVYFETGYSFKYFDIFAGGGNKAFTTDGNFNITNIGISASKDIKLTENYGVSLSSALILNPNTEQLHLVFTLGL